MVGYGTDVLRGIADGAWIVLVAFAARMASFALAFSGSGSSTLALPPMGLMALFAIAVLMLGVIVGPTYGALLAAAIFAPLLTTAGVPHDSCALVFSLATVHGSVLNAGDLTNDIFNLPVYLPALDVPLLTPNQNFQDIDILAGSLTSGSLALNLIGTASTAKLRYVFPANFSVQSGATLSVAANVNVLIQPGVTLTDSGTLNFGSGDTVTLNGYNANAQITPENRPSKR